VQSDEELRHWVRHNAESIYHPVGTTCKMQPWMRRRVVDPRHRVPRPHACSGADRMVDRFGIVPHPVAQFLVALHRGAGRQLDLAVRVEGWLRQYLARQLDARTRRSISRDSAP